MNQFPVLVEHGPLIWRVVQIVFVVVVVLGIWGVRRLLARTAQRAVVAKLRANHGTIRGVLRGGASTVKVEPAGMPLLTNRPVTWQTEALRLETADRTIELLGPVEVVAGTSFHGRRGRLPALDPAVRAVLTEALPWSVNQVRSAIALHVEAGDEVEVHGTPEPSAGPAEVSPRDADIVWSMRGQGESPLAIAAMRPASPRLPLGLVRTAAVALLSFGASTVALGSFSEGWVKECRDLGQGDGKTPLALDNGHVCVLAASVPAHREAGITALHETLAAQRYHDDQSVAGLDALDRERVSCAELPANRLAAQRYEAALVEARRCGDPRTEHEALVALGYFEQAVELPVPATFSALPQPALPTVSTLVAAGRWTQAADAVRSREPDGRLWHRDRPYRECLADWFAGLGGELTAGERFRTAPGCAELRRAIEPTDDTLVWREPEATLVDPDRAYDALDLWLPTVEKPGLRNRAFRLRQRAVHQVLHNDTDGALATAAEIDELTRQILERGDPEDYGFTLRMPVLLVPAIQLYTPVVFSDVEARLRAAEERMVSFAKRVSTERDGTQMVESNREYNQQQYARLFARSSELPPAWRERLSELALAAREGRLDHVMERVQMPSYSDLGLTDLIAVLPHIPELRPALARELPHVHAPFSWRTDPASHVLEAFSWRELLEAVGATSAAAEWDAIFRRYDAMLRAPQRAVALRAL